MYLNTKDYKIKTKVFRDEYVKLIKTVLLERRNDNDEIYYEKHHIFPKSLFPEWKNKKNNIIFLTRDEHLLAHKLLVEIYPVKEMSYAYSFMQGLMHIGLNHKDFSKELWNDPNYRKRVTEKNRIYWSNKENLEKHSKRLKTWFKEHPEKIGASVKSTKQRVQNIETGIIFDDMQSAAKWAGLKTCFHIGEVCRHKRAFAGKTPDGKSASWEYVGLSIRSQNRAEYYNECINTKFIPKQYKETYRKKKENGWISKFRKSVYCITTDEYFSAVYLAEKYYNITGIAAVCRGKHPYAGKHPITKEKLVWIYKEKPENKEYIV